MTESLEQKIGRLEREHDMWRDQVIGFEATVAHKRRECPSDLGLSKVESALEDARENFSRVREQLEIAWAERNQKRG